MELSEKCLVKVLEIIAECYKDFDIYIDPRILFTERGIKALNWTVEYVEEFVGFPRGYKDIPYENGEQSMVEIRLKALRSFGGDETLQRHLVKYLTKTK